MSLTTEYLKEQLDYDPETGHFRWRAFRRGVSCGSPAGGVNAIGYIQIGLNKRRYLGHRLAWFWMTGDWPKEEIDHINGNPSDNRFSNLRLATSSQNGMNMRRRSDNKSGYKGVHLHTPGVWRARIKRGGVITEVGCFQNPEDAYHARIKKLADVHGEFARRG